MLAFSIFLQEGYHGVHSLLNLVGDPDVYVIDCDTEGAEDGYVTIIELDEGKPEEVFLRKWEFRKNDRDPKFIAQLERKHGGKEEPEC